MVAYYLGWREIFLLVLPVAFLSLVITYKTIPTDHTRNDAFKFDYLSFAFAGGGLHEFLVGIEPTRAWFSKCHHVRVIRFGGSGVCWFLYRSKHSNKQFLNLVSLKVKALRFAMPGYMTYVYQLDG